MSISGGWVVVFVTAGSRDEAEKIANVIVGERLAACVSIVDGIKSIYWWKGKVESSRETLLIIKTRSDVLGRLVKRIKELHGYEVPEIIAVPIIMGLADYLKWIDETIS